MQTRTVLSYHYTPTGIPNNSKQNKTPWQYQGPAVIWRSSSNFQTGLLGMQRTVTLGKSMATSYTASHSPYDPAIPLFILKRSESITIQHTKPCMKVYNNFIHNCLKLGKTQISICWIMGRPNCMST